MKSRQASASPWYLPKLDKYLTVAYTHGVGVAITMGWEPHNKGWQSLYLKKQVLLNQREKKNIILRGEREQNAKQGMGVWVGQAVGYLCEKHKIIFYI